MLDAKDAVVWVNYDTKQVMVRSGDGRPLQGAWSDPIGAAYTEWNDGNDAQRVRLMLETVLDLTMEGIPLKTILTASSSAENSYCGMSSGM
jgi:hypothetical protein